MSPSPLSCSVETSRTATQVASISVGAAIDAGVCGRGALVHILAATGTLIKVKARGTHALVAAQRVVAGGRAANRRSLTLVLICSERREEVLNFLCTPCVNQLNC